MALCYIVTPVGMLGYGFVDEELRRGLDFAVQHSRRRRVPVAIVLDSGSTDSGPAKLALGVTTCPRASYVRDLRVLLRAVRDYGVPLLVSSVGGAGLDAHVSTFVDMVAELAAEDGYGRRLKVVSLISGVPKPLVLGRLAAGAVAGCGPCVPALTVADVTASPVLVAQMGAEPFVQALAAHPDVDIVLGGRAYDPAPYVAFAAWAAGATHSLAGLDAAALGGFTHMGKVMECGGLCATPKSKSALATVYADGAFDVRPLQPGAVCIPRSVAAHVLYEKSRPDVLAGPGGTLDVTQATYTALSDGVSVRVRGGVFRPVHPYTVKLEGARVLGHRTIFMGSFCDPILIPQLPDLLEVVKGYVAQQHADVDGAWQLDFHVYDGGDTQDQALSQRLSVAPGAAVVFVVGEALADTQALATSVASTARVACVHGPYRGQKANGGNLGMGLGGLLELETGPCAAFSVYHLMDLEPGEEGAAAADVESRALFRWWVSWAGHGERIQRVGSTTDDTEAEDDPKEETEEKTEEKEENETKVESSSLSSTLGDLASTIRYKNAGPYEITLDVMFDDPAVYARVKAAGVLTPATIARLYHLDVADLVYCGFFDPALTFKATLPRRRRGLPAVSGGFMEADVHGSQQHRPLMGLSV